jgi:2-hydroxychromene-2-carboxylate isomerase
MKSTGVLVKLSGPLDGHRDPLATAAPRGTFGAPTFFVSAEMFFGKDRLCEVEEAILNSR